jgi:hypothetical protein
MFEVLPAATEVILIIIKSIKPRLPDEIFALSIFYNSIFKL